MIHLTSATSSLLYIGEDMKCKDESRECPIEREDLANLSLIPEIREDIKAIREGLWALKIKVALLGVVAGGGAAGIIEFITRIL